MKALQEHVRGFVEEHGLEAPVEARLLDLVSEVGELSKEMLKVTRYGRAPFHPPAEWAGELGDVLFALVCVANSTGVDLQQALEAALERYGERLDRGTMR